MRIAVAAPNELATAAGVAVAGVGGNAVDAALAAAIVAMVAEPGVSSLAGGAYLLVAPPDASTVVVDANVTMPGRGTDVRPGQGTFAMHTDYGGGVEMTAGHGSVATPLTPAGLALVHERWGRAAWADVWAPAIDVARDGFPMGGASSYYLEYVHETLYGWHAPSHAAIHDDDGVLIPEGGPVRVEALADSLEAIAAEGVRVFTHGDLGARIVDDVQANGGLLTRADLEHGVPVVRPALTSVATTDQGRWQVATNPGPAIGGVTLTAMLELLTRSGPLPGHWDDDLLARMVRAQDVVLSRRIRDLDPSRDREAAAATLLAEIDAGDFDAAMASPSTIHVSAVDTDGLGCSITASAGYGSGVMPPGTGIWLNNCLGEHELNPHGLHAWEPGDHLPSNMAPTIAVGPDGQRVVIGTPGADRITTALIQTLVHVFGGASLAEAIATPRLHVRHDPDGSFSRIAHEDDLDVSGLGLATERHHAESMYFGGVAAAVLHADGRLEAGADPRRTGSTAIT